jgi:metal-sulfur cluster biosynthetic enzyme
MHESRASQPSPVHSPETEALWQALRQVSDPEFPISLVDLGLIYGIRRAGECVEIDLTFTATACPCMDFIRTDIRERLLQEPGVQQVRINEVWDPPWTPERMTEEGKAALRRVGVAA